MEIIEINKELYPIRFGMNALRMFCKEQKIPLTGLADLANEISLDEACMLILCGLRDGARKQNQVCKLSIEDIADALDDDMELITKAMGIFADSFNTKEKGNEKEETKSLKKK